MVAGKGAEERQDNDGRNITFIYIRYDGNCSYSAGGRPSISQRNLGSDVLKIICTQEKKGLRSPAYYYNYANIRTDIPTQINRVCVDVCYNHVARCLRSQKRHLMRILFSTLDARDHILSSGPLTAGSRLFKREMQVAVPSRQDAARRREVVIVVFSGMPENRPYLLTGARLVEDINRSTQTTDRRDCEHEKRDRDLWEIDRPAGARS